MKRILCKVRYYRSIGANWVESITWALRLK